MTTEASSSKADLLKPPVIRSAEFVKSAVKPAQYPPEDFPEAAFAGRSNVGKSSLINGLLQRKKLVRTSRTPGRTQTLNFFVINNAFRFVDLPGYGFAKVPESVRTQWGPMVETYMESRRTLKGVVQIMDARRPPTADDLKLWNWLVSHGIPVIPVSTKKDKLKRSQEDRARKETAAALGVDPSFVVLFSATKGEGRDALWARLLPWLEIAPEAGEKG